MSKFFKKIAFDGAASNRINSENSDSVLINKLKEKKIPQTAQTVVDPDLSNSAPRKSR